MRYGLVGSTGRMGQEIQKAFADHTLCMTVDAEKTWSDGTQPEVIVDFSNRSSLTNTVNLCVENGSALVIGTTGLNEDDFSMLRELGKDVPVVQSYNFSVGVNILKMILASYSKLLEDWDSEIVEIHHNKKKDAPSGTAIMLQDALQKPAVMHSLRMGGIPGDHSVIFANEGEVLSFNHRAISRAVFAYGALEAAEFARTANPGFYTFEEVLRCKLKK
ncbi:MAG: 4-hydroxy-tetrahydrodipicolinate reductase [Acetomicrobium sp.]|jgi:4-hydroxy-tetrahydrodipicolinate reductase|uniref:4-hydroxy-tetrahydrodipicolinate reductase n=1 Tax=Acetomicrobium thermoterrenum DSM 13490 TaxID=1120987 RepID=A0A1H3EVD3_9BACT|nr:4-hydroxy-tetrahydrodipicolinate reductase [Acetomicrobium thermoterrenum]MBC7321873.1 4-hydroxy-tetrahydrodipicolinate reductase [Acetomicrobium sp.]SDX81884.1 dihydrodipicolinate reductase [Acetomicrobium thermoterrenum DSM 13490]